MSRPFKCNCCGNGYEHHSSMYRHQKTCKGVKSGNAATNVISESESQPSCTRSQHQLHQPCADAIRQLVDGTLLGNFKFPPPPDIEYLLDEGASVDMLPDIYRKLSKFIILYQKALLANQQVGHQVAWDMLSGMVFNIMVLANKFFRCLRIKTTT